MNQPPTNGTHLDPNLKPIVIAVTLAILWSLEAFLPWVPDRTHRITHGVNNLAIGAVNAVVTGVVFAGMTLWITTWAAMSGFGLLNRFEWPVWVNGLAAVLLIDLWQYAWHRLNHRVPLLWRFHSVHHADRDLDATTAVRFHTVEIIASATARLAILPILGAGVEHVLLYEVFVMPVILFHHSNVRFSEWADRVLRTVIVTPAMHRVHHSRQRHEHDSNYASIFSFWDRLWRSYAGARNDVVVGLPDMEPRVWRSLGGMLSSPFERGSGESGGNLP